MAALRAHWPLAAGIATLWLAIAALLAASLAATDGHVVYALDDPYIHMAMAKNLAQHGVLGVTRHEFTSTTSSPLWTLLLALSFAAFGVRDGIPLLINVALATGVVVLAYRIIDARSSSRLATCGVILALIFLTPLPAMVLSGTEHLLQTLLCLAFAWQTARIAAAPRQNVSAWLYVLAPLTTAVRYEGLFLVAAAAALLAARRRAWAALIVVLLSCIPVVLYAMLSTSHGWSWLPNALLAKGAFPRQVDSLSSAATYLSRWLMLLTASPHMLAALVLAGAAAVVAWRGSRRAPVTQDGVPADTAGGEGPYLVMLFAAAAVLHLQFARIGSFYRYEAYLIALAVLGSGLCVTSIVARWQIDPHARRRSPAAAAVVVAVVLLALLPLSRRALASLVNGPRATRNIYQQQVQMGRFLQRFYAGQRVAINDIGAVNYLADVRSLDLWGLAQLEIAQLRRSRRYSTEDIRRLASAHGVVIAVVYERGFARAGGLPREWIKVGEWEIPDNFICGYPTVSFWAVDPAAAPRLKRDLAAFTAKLPRGVQVRAF